MKLKDQTGREIKPGHVVHVMLSAPIIAGVVVDVHDKSVLVPMNNQPAHIMVQVMLPVMAGQDGTVGRTYIIGESMDMVKDEHAEKHHLTLVGEDPKPS